MRSSTRIYFDEGFVEQLRFLRRARNLTQSDVADLLKVASGRISNLEAGRVFSLEKELYDDLKGLLDTWEKEVREQPAMAREPLAMYRATVACPSCQEFVPGPEMEASHCLNCGEKFPVVRCYRCGWVALAKGQKKCGRCTHELT